MSKTRVGEKFNSLTIIGPGEPYITPKGVSCARWDCLCDCGNVITVRYAALTSGNTKSCGCIKKGLSKPGNIKHGYREHKMWGVYYAMIRRCTDSRDSNYDSYGGRGITVCERWSCDPKIGFPNFLEDMGDRPEGFNLDRINPDEGYYPENCRWVDKSTSSYNTRKKSSNTSGRTGVKWNKKLNKWIAAIDVGGQYIHLGCYYLFDEAVKAREQAELLYFNELKAEARIV